MELLGIEYLVESSLSANMSHDLKHELVSTVLF